MQRANPWDRRTASWRSETIRTAGTRFLRSEFDGRVFGIEGTRFCASENMRTPKAVVFSNDARCQEAVSALGHVAPFKRGEKALAALLKNQFSPEVDQSTGAGREGRFSKAVWNPAAGG